MSKKYQLWLDESGDFQDETSKVEKKLNPSLVGGILVDYNMVEPILAADLIDEGRGHAVELSFDLKRECVLPVLETLQKEYGVKEVFFENADYEDEDSNRQLYLRIMAEGILQLLIELNAMSESVELKVLIAQRQDVTASNGEKRINELEYVKALEYRIEKKKTNKKISLDSNTVLEFNVVPAHKDTRLQLADYACNTRLTRTSYTFKEANMQQRLKLLYDDAFLFTMKERGTDSYIKQALTQERISDAILELYTTTDQLLPREKDKLLNLIIERINTLGYRLVKSQLRHCTSEIIAYANHQEEFETGEAFLSNLIEHMIPVMKKNNVPIEKLYFNILLQLADMFLREGDIINARKTLVCARAAHYELESSLEEVLSYYQLQEKEAILYINEFDYVNARQLMEMAVKSFDYIIDTIQGDNYLKDRFSNMKSEYLGDALCMQIYAMMFQQRDNRNLYEELCRLSDRGLNQYSNHDGELERHRQYRCHIECEANHFSDALTWLLKCKGICNQEITRESIEQFLNKLCDTEMEVSQCYYLMYYLHVMSEAKILGNRLAELMFDTLNAQTELLKNTKLVHVNEDDGMEKIDLDQIREQACGIQYHPREILYWKYATYLYLSKEYRKARVFYGKAISLCNQYENYHTMRITGLGIWAEYICCLNANKEQEQANEEYGLLNDAIEALLQEELCETTKFFIEKIKCNLELVPYKDNRLLSEKLWKVARMITY